MGVYYKPNYVVSVIITPEQIPPTFLTFGFRLLTFGRDLRSSFNLNSTSIFRMLSENVTWDVNTGSSILIRVSAVVRFVLHRVYLYRYNESMLPILYDLTRWLA